MKAVELSPFLVVECPTMELLKEQLLPINVMVDILYLVMLSVSVRVMATGMAKYHSAQKVSYASYY